MPVDLKKYPDNWKQIASAVKWNANWQCAKCGTVHGDERVGTTHKRRYYKRPYKVQMQAAHINHDESDSRRENLFALCQTCHNRHDKYQRADHARITKQKKRYDAQIAAGQLTLFNEGESA